MKRLLISTSIYILVGLLIIVHAYGQKDLSNKAKAIAIPTKGVAGVNETIIDDYVADSYIQHHPTVPDGKEGVLLLIDKIEKGEIKAPRINTVLAIEDEDYVVLHSEFHWPSREAAFEIFRFEDGKAVEHWMGIAAHPETTANGHTMLDGETQIKNRGETEANKKVAKAFMETVFIGGDLDRAAEFCHADYIQHNPYVDNTVAGFRKSVMELKRKGIDVQIDKIHLVLGEGNFAFLLRKASSAASQPRFMTSSG